MSTASAAASSSAQAPSETAPLSSGEDLVFRDDAGFVRADFGQVNGGVVPFWSAPEGTCQCHPDSKDQDDVLAIVQDNNPGVSKKVVFRGNAKSVQSCQISCQKCQSCQPPSNSTNLTESMARLSQRLSNSGNLTVDLAKQNVRKMVSKLGVFEILLLTVVYVVSIIWSNFPMNLESFIRMKIDLKRRGEISANPGCQICFQKGSPEIVDGSKTSYCHA